MVDVHRMVRGLGQLVQDPHVTARLGGGAEDGQAEVFLADDLRAGEGEQDTARLDLLERDGIELAITLQGVAQDVLVLGERGRVEDDQVVVVSHLFEILERVDGVGLVAGIVREVKLDVLVGQHDRFRGAVDGMDALRPAAHGVEGEAARIAEHIEDIPAFGVTLQKRTVLALVDEETGLLALLPVDVEAQAVLERGFLIVTAHEVAILAAQVRFVGQGCLRFIIDILKPVAQDLFQCLGDLVTGVVHPDRVRLHDRRMGVKVDDEPRQVISLTVDEAEGVVPLRVGGQSQCLTERIGLADTLCPKRLIDFSLLEGEYADGDAADLVMADGQELVVGAINLHEVALFGLAVDGLDRSGEYPRMKTQERFLFLGFEIYFAKFHYIVEFK